MQQHRLRWLFSAVMLVMALLIPVVPSGGIGVQPGLAAQSGDPVTLNLWMFEGEDQFLPVLKEAFEASHPNVTLEITLIPEDQYVVKLDTAMAAGGAPDLGYLYEERWVKLGKVLPIDEMVAANAIDLADFNQAVIKGACTIDAQLYCIGSYLGAVVLLYDKAKFDAAGLPYPSATEPMTIDEYAALAQQLTVPNEDITKQVWGATSAEPYWWMSRLNMVSEDGLQTEGFINDEPTKHTYDVLGKMILDGTAPSGSVMQSMGAESEEGMFQQGQLAMVIGDFSQISNLEAAGIDYGVATLPVEQAGDAAYLPMWTDSLAVFSDSKHPAEAMEFLAFLATEGQRLRVEVTGEPPLSAVAAEEFGWADLGNVTGRNEFLATVAAGSPLRFVPGFQSVTAPLNDAFTQIAGGEVSAAEALDSAAPRMQDNLNQAWETWNRIGQ